MRLRSRQSGDKVIKPMGRTTTTKRSAVPIWLVVSALCGTAFGQQPAIVSTRIVSLPNTGIFLDIDGQTYSTPITLLWPQGSRHTLHAYNQITTDAQIQYLFTSWSAQTESIASADSSTIIVTADPNVPEIDASFSIGYRVR